MDMREYELYHEKKNYQEIIFLKGEVNLASVYHKNVKRQGSVYEFLKMPVASSVYDFSLETMWILNFKHML